MTQQRTPSNNNTVELPSFVRLRLFGLYGAIAIRSLFNPRSVFIETVQIGRAVEMLKQWQRAEPMVEALMKSLSAISTESTPGQVDSQVIICDTEQVDLYPVEMQQIMLLLGHPEALVTDRSTVSDFYSAAHCDVHAAAEQFTVDRLTLRAGRPVTAHEPLWRIAKSIHERQDDDAEGTNHASL